MVVPSTSTSIGYELQTHRSSPQPSPLSVAPDRRPTGRPPTSRSSRPVARCRSPVIAIGRQCGLVLLRRGSTRPLSRSPFTNGDTLALGRHIDTSTQHSFADCSQLQLMNALVGAKTHDRMPGAVQLGEFLVPWVYECADGHVTITFMFGEMLARFNDRLVGWMYDEGFADDAMRDTDWGDLGMAVFEGA